MTVNEMHIGARLGVDQIASNRGDDFLPEEIDYYLNRAIRDYVDQWRPFISIDNRAKDERGDEAMENLRTLITEDDFSSFNAVANHPTAQSIAISALSQTYDHFISARINTAKGWKNARFMDANKFALHSQTYSNRPFFRELPLMVTASKIYIMGDTEDTISSASITYLKVPASVDYNNTIDSDLPDHTHGTVVDLAVQYMLQALGLSTQAQGDS